MANRRISELQEIAGIDLADADLLTVVQTAEVDPAIKNKKTISLFILASFTLQREFLLFF